MSTSLVDHVVDKHAGFGEQEGLKVLPPVHQPGTRFDYRTEFKDGTGELLREEMIPVLVSHVSRQDERAMGQRVLDSDSQDVGHREREIKQLYQAQQAFREIAGTHLSKTIRRLHGELPKERQAKIHRELEHLGSYATSESDRLESFINAYRR